MFNIKIAIASCLLMIAGCLSDANIEKDGDNLKVEDVENTISMCSDKLDNDDDGYIDCDDQSCFDFAVCQIPIELDTIIEPIDTNKVSQSLISSEIEVSSSSISFVSSEVEQSSSSEVLISSLIEQSSSSSSEVLSSSSIELSSSSSLFLDLDSFKVYYDLDTSIGIEDWTLRDDQDAVHGSTVVQWNSKPYKSANITISGWTLNRWAAGSVIADLGNENEFESDDWVSVKLRFTGRSTGNQVLTIKTYEEDFVRELDWALPEISFVTNGVFQTFYFQMKDLERAQWAIDRGASPTRISKFSNISFNWESRPLDVDEVFNESLHGGTESIEIKCLAIGAVKACG
jgi:hypothetical protein